MNLHQAKALRVWIREVNKMGEKFGYEDLAGTPDDPDDEYVARFQSGETPDEVITSDFGTQQPSS